MLCADALGSPVEPELPGSVDAEPAALGSELPGSVVVLESLGALGSDALGTAVEELDTPGSELEPPGSELDALGSELDALGSELDALGSVAEPPDELSGSPLPDEPVDVESLVEVPPPQAVCAGSQADPAGSG